MAMKTVSSLLLATAGVAFAEPLRVQKHGNSPSSNMYPNSCEGLSDGTHQLKLLDGDEYPVVELECSNGYMILDVDKDDNLKDYFSSWAMWHYAIAGPTNDDHANWVNWFLPAKNGKSNTDGYTHEYIVSSDCSSCDESSKTDDFGSDATYMTGNLFGCFWKIRGLHDCDMDWDSYACYQCECTTNLCNKVDFDTIVDGDSDDKTTGTCATLAKAVDLEVAESHDDCTSSFTEKFYKPSIGTDGRNCMCVSPVYSDYYEGEFVEKIVEDTEEEDTGSVDDTYYLYQKDFTYGTYRITKSGTYILAEDITFDFNAGTSNEEGAWMPHADQYDDYPGAASMRDPYFLGFFAGITVETSDVVIDLNGKTLQQSKEFYYQQRWFAHIELANQPFLPAQGPGMFGDTVSSANNVEIKNGIFDLTAHHAIHGNKNKNVKIHDVEIRNFETHGIQLNGFENVEIYNVEIHTSSQKAFLKGEYGHARYILPRLKAIYEEDTSQTISLPNYDGEVTMKDIYEDMQNQIDIAYDYVVNGNTNIKTEVGKETWETAKANFLYLNEDDEIDDISTMKDAAYGNSNGLPYGTAMYGIFLSFDGANVFSWGSSVLKSYNAKIYNVQIHGLRHKMHEYMRTHNTIPFNVNPFNAVFDVKAALSDPSDLEGSTYVGNIMTDAYVAMNQMTNDWGYLGMQNFDQGLIDDFALGTYSLDSNTFQVKCNSDVMTHSGKGMIGIRLDGIEGIEIDNVEIYDMYDYTKLGSETCGEYDAGTFTDGGHFLQKGPMQVGFSGNMMQGISIVGTTGSVSNVNIHDIGSATGLAMGLAIWTNNDIELNGDIKASNIKAGFQVDSETLEYASRPNKAPEACGISTYWEYLGSNANDTLYTQVTTGNADELNIVTECVTGHVGCFDVSDFGASTLGSYVSCQDANIDVSQAIDEKYMTDIDRQYLGKKDEATKLNDYDSRKDSLLFEDSYQVFADHEDEIQPSSDSGSDDEEQDDMPDDLPPFSKEEAPARKEKVVSNKKEKDLNVDVVGSNKNAMDSKWFVTSIIVVASVVVLSVVLFYVRSRSQTKKTINSGEGLVDYGSI